MTTTPAVTGPGLTAVNDINKVVQANVLLSSDLLCDRVYVRQPDRLRVLVETPVPRARLRQQSWYTIHWGYVDGCIALCLHVMLSLFLINVRVKGAW